MVGLDRASAIQRFLADKANRIGRPLRLRVQLRSFDAICRLVEMQCWRRHCARDHRSAYRAYDGDQRRSAYGSLGAARADDLRARGQFTAAIRAAARRSFAGKRVDASSPRDQHPIVEVEDHCRIVVVSAFEREVGAGTIFGGNGPDAQSTDVFAAQASRRLPALQTMRTRCRPANNGATWRPPLIAAI